MKFEIPNLKTIIVECPDRYSPYTTINLKHCLNCPIKQEYCLNYYIKRLKELIKLKCDYKNEEKFCKKEKCENCNDYTYIPTNDGFLCPNCGQEFSLTEKQMKKTLNEDFEEIDNEELNEKLEEIKTRFQLIKERFTLSEEEKSFVKLNKKQETNNIITFKRKGK